MGWTRRSKEHAAEQTPFQVLRPKKLVSLTLRSSDIIAAPIFKTNLARAKVAGCHWLSCDFTFGKTKRPNSHVSFPSAMSKFISLESRCSWRKRWWKVVKGGNIAGCQILELLCDMRRVHQPYVDWKNHGPLPSKPRFRPLLADDSALCWAPKVCELQRNHLASMKNWL